MASTYVASNPAYYGDATCTLNLPKGAYYVHLITSRSTMYGEMYIGANARTLTVTGGNYTGASSDLAITVNITDKNGTITLTEAGGNGGGATASLIAIQTE